MTESVAVFTGVVLAVIALPFYLLAVRSISSWWIDRDERRPARR